MKPIFYVLPALLFTLAACEKSKQFAESDKINAMEVVTPQKTKVDVAPSGGVPEGSYSYTVKSNGATENFTDAQGSVAQPDNKPAPEPVAIDTRKIIKQGEVRFETDDLNAMRSRINAVVFKHGGYVAKENETKSQELLETQFVLRMPADKFDLVLQDVSSGVERFDMRRVDAQDVTEEFIDVQARINTKKALLARYQELLTKADKIESILAVEQQIGDLQSDIEAAEGRLRYLQSQTSFATLTVETYQRIAAPIGFSAKFGAAFVTGWHALLYVVIGLSSVWPFLLLIAIVMFVAFRWQKKRRLDPAV